MTIFKVDAPGMVLLVDSWESQEALDFHHSSPMMAEIVRLREKYDLHMSVEKFENGSTFVDDSFIRK